MADNPYDVLGVPHDADQAVIRKAYRTLAKQHHPDLNPGDKAAESAFKAMSAANDLLSDPDKRAAFDRGEIDAEGQPRPERATYRDFAEGMSGRRYRPAGTASGHPAGGWGASEEELGDIFGTIFGEHGRAGFASGGGTARGTRRALWPDRRPDRSRAWRHPTPDPSGWAHPGCQNPHRLRGRTQPAICAGKGAPGLNGGAPGDALIQIKVAEHPFFPSPGQHHHARPAGHHPGSGPRRTRVGAHAVGCGVDDDPTRLGHRPAVAASRPRRAGARGARGRRSLRDAARRRRQSRIRRWTRSSRTGSQHPTTTRVVA